MKRYKIEPRYQYPDDVWVKATIDNDGEWVKWEDVKELMKKLGRCEPATIEHDSIECNCEAMAGIMRRRPWGSDKYWICPAHGYKRL